MKSSARTLLVACLGVAALQFSGCASPPDTADMTVTGQVVSGDRYPAALRDNVFIGNVAGGEKTNPMWTSEINAEGLKIALAESFRNAGLYAPESSAGYRLTAVILDVQQPLVGFDLTVTTTIDYTLQMVSNGTEPLHEAISADHTATVGQSWYGVERLKLANEGAVRENIRKLLERLSTLKLP